MQSHYEIPDTFWSLFRSVNREIYIESLLCINQEYEYSNYFLTREVCLQILSDRNTQKGSGWSVRSQRRSWICWRLLLPGF